MLRTTAIHGGTDTCYRENHNCPAFILEPSLEIKRVLRAEPALLKIVVPDTRRRVNNTRRPVEKRTSMYAFQRQVFLAKNLLLFGTTPVLGRSDTLRIFRSGAQ